MDFKELLNVDPLLSDRVRLALMATLAAAKEPLDFATLLTTLDLSKGNLSSHMRKLEEAGLVKIQKEFVERKPRTTYRCTDKGQKALQEYLTQLEAVISLARKDE